MEKSGLRQYRDEPQDVGGNETVNSNYDGIVRRILLLSHWCGHYGADERQFRPIVLFARRFSANCGNCYWGERTL